MLRSVVRALDRRRAVAGASAAALFLLGLLFWPGPILASSASARVVLRPDSPWSAARAADLLLSDDVLRPVSGDVADLRSRLRVTTEPDAVRVASTAFFGGTAASRVNAVANSFIELSGQVLRQDLERELGTTQAAIAQRAGELAALPASRPDPRVEAEAIRGMDREIARLSAALEKGEVGPPAPLVTTESDRIAGAIESAKAELARLQATYPADWPPVAKAAADIEDLRVRRQQALNREALAARFAPVRQTIDKLRELSAERERRAAALDAEPKTAQGGSPELRRAGLQTHLRELEERRARLLSGLVKAEGVVERVEPAARAGDTRSALPLLLLLAVLAGAAAALVAERMTSTIRTEHDVRRFVNLPILGVIPKAVDPSDRLVLHAPASSLVEPSNTAAALLEGRAAAAGAKMIGVTSARPGEGKSTTAANLAVSLARGLARVLLVDADLRRPSQHVLFDLGDVQGLSAYLSGAANQFDAVLATTEMENLTVLPAGAPLQNPIPFLRSERLRAVIPELKERYDFVIFDLPPVRSAADALVLAPTLDGLLLVLGAGETGKDDATAAKRLIREARGKLMGCVLNKAEIYSRGYYEYIPSPAAEA